jgi:hypothetical protein
MPQAYIDTGTDYPVNARFVPVDVMLAAAGHVAREWGADGYSVACIAASTFGGAVFQGRAGDGSTFAFQLDRWGNVLPMDAAMADAIRRDLMPMPDNPPHRALRAAVARGVAEHGAITERHHPQSGAEGFGAY